MAAFATSMSGMGLRRSRVPLRIECAHKKGAGSTKNGRDSNSKRLGVKVYGGQHVTPGGIIVRQRGSKVSEAKRPHPPPPPTSPPGKESEAFVFLLLVVD